jgi:ATP-dependent Clp protease ATP-binding subunit ClpA
LAAQGITRLDVTQFIARDRKVPQSPRDQPRLQAVRCGSGTSERGRRLVARSPDGVRDQPDGAARAGELDPLIGRADELQRTMEILCRRRKNNPVFVGDAGVGKTALAEGLASRLLQDDVPDLLEGAEVFSLDTGALLAGTRFRGDFEERFKAVINALAKRPMPILFIDEIHSTVGAGATTGGTMDLATLISQCSRDSSGCGSRRTVSSTSQSRALARRLQRIAIDDRASGTVRILRALIH